MVATTRHCGGVPAQAAGGFTYVWVLLAIAIMGVGLLAVSEVWVTSARRQRLVELDWIGAQFVQAIGGYYEATPGVIIKTYPLNLQDLLEDRRYLTVRRYLRQIYANPFSGKADWTLVITADGGFSGVRVVVPTGTGDVLREYVYLRPMKP